MSRIDFGAKPFMYMQELIDKVIVTDPEHVEIVWKFKDEVRKFIGI